MKKLLLTLIASFTILFTKAQCQADFQYTSSGFNLNLISTSINAGNTLNSQTPTWDFGDGSPQVTGLDSITHVYQNAGVYNVCIEIFTWPTSWTTCSSIYCDSILIGNSIPASWDCNPTTGCYDPGTGLGQYSSFASCDTMCGAPTPSWDCDPVSGCYDPNNGLGQYTTLASCQSICQSQIVSPCDSIDIVGSQSQLTMEVMSGTNVNSPLYIVTTDFNGYIVGEDSLTWTHDAWPIMALTDSIITCITYVNGVDTLTCCVEFFWNGSFWAKMGSVTSIEEIGSFDKKLIKVVDMLGRETSINSNQTLFFIYEDGLIEKRYIIERK